MSDWDISQIFQKVCGLFFFISITMPCLTPTPLVMRDVGRNHPDV